MKLASWKEDFEGRLDSSVFSSLEVLNEEECKKLFSVSFEVLFWMNESSVELKLEFKDEDSEDDSV